MRICDMLSYKLSYKLSSSWRAGVGGNIITCNEPELYL